MRHVCLLILPAVLLAPHLAHGQAAPVATPAAAAPIPQAKSTALAVTVEALSPVGGAGCFYRGRHLPGALVVAGSLISGGMLIYAATHDDRDATIVNAVAYGVMRAIGLAGAAVPDAPLPAPPRAFTPPRSTTAIGFSYRLSF